MDKTALQQGLKRISYGIVAAFIGPVIIMQAFKNEGHPFFWPVLIVGIVLCGVTIGYGFLGIRTLASAFLGKKRKG